MLTVTHLSFAVQKQTENLTVNVNVNVHCRSAPPIAVRKRYYEARTRDDIALRTFTYVAETILRVYYILVPSAIPCE